MEQRPKGILSTGLSWFSSKMRKLTGKNDSKQQTSVNHQKKNSKEEQMTGTM